MAKELEYIEYNNLKILNNFAKCCATCEHRPFGQGYSGTKNCGICETLHAIVHRASVCPKYKLSDKTGNLLGSMKSQSRWLR